MHGGKLTFGSQMVHTLCTEAISPSTCFGRLLLCIQALSALVDYQDELKHEVKDVVPSLMEVSSVDTNAAVAGAAVVALWKLAENCQPNQMLIRKRGGLSLRGLHLLLQQGPPNSRYAWAWINI